MKINVVKFDNMLKAFDENAEKTLKKYENGETFEIEIKQVDRRSIEQLNFYWKACHLVSENIENDYIKNKDQVDYWCRLKCHFIDKEKSVFLVDKNNVGSWHYVPKSISFAKSQQKEFNDYMNKAIPVLADMISVDIDTLKIECGAHDIITMFKGDYVK